MLRLPEGSSELPHVVKLSGGRSSAAMLMMLLEQGSLSRERGDVVVFNNTSAEHPRTYGFVRWLKEETERRGIPFLLTQFRTVEELRRGEWKRIPSWSLVNDRPVSEGNPDGFAERGEAFEEMLSWAGYLPNRFSRSCTHRLKLEVTRGFLADWLSGRDAVPALGHGGASSRVGTEGGGDPLDTMHARHLRRHGRLSREDLGRKRAYALSRPCRRPEQPWRAFSKAWRPFGAKGADHVALLGIRADEPARSRRILERARAGRGCGVQGADKGVPGEIPCMPLAEAGISRREVGEFWSRQDFALDLPEGGELSNCVHCFMKGGKVLERARTSPALDAVPGAPSDVAWWRRMETTYGRRSRDGDRWIGFLGADGGSVHEAMPCDCGD